MRIRHFCALFCFTLALAMSATTSSYAAPDNRSATNNTRKAEYCLGVENASITSGQAKCAELQKPTELETAFCRRADEVSHSRKSRLEKYLVNAGALKKEDISKPDKQSTATKQGEQDISDCQAHIASREFQSCAKECLSFGQNVNCFRELCMADACRRVGACEDISFVP